MARYRIGMDEMEEYIRIYTGKIENCAKKFGLELDGDAYYAPSKKVYNDFIRRLNPNRERVEYENTVKSGIPTWKKDDYSGDWLVLISGDKVNPGTVVEVKKRGGAVSKVKILKASRSTDEGTLYEVQDVTERPATVFVAPAMSDPAVMRIAAEKLSGITHTFSVEKIGRKWMDVLVEGRNNGKYRAKLLIDDTTNDLAIGGFYTVICKLVDESDRYGSKYFLYPYTADGMTNAIAAAEEKAREAAEKAAAEARRRAEEKAHYEAEKLGRRINEWMGYIRKSAKEGFFYEKGVSVIKELGAWADNMDEISAIEAKINEMNDKRELESWADGLQVPVDIEISDTGELMYEGRKYFALASKHCQNGGEFYRLKAIDVTERDLNSLLPELTGSEKQVAWADDIRAEFIKNTSVLKRVAELFTKCEATTDVTERAKFQKQIQQKPNLLSVSRYIEEKLGLTDSVNFKYRYKILDSYRASLQNVSKYLNRLTIMAKRQIITEASAKYWIDGNMTYKERTPDCGRYVSIELDKIAIKLRKAGLDVLDTIYICGTRNAYWDDTFFQIRLDNKFVKLYENGGHPDLLGELTKIEENCITYRYDGDLLHAETHVKDTLGKLLDWASELTGAYGWKDPRSVIESSASQGAAKVASTAGSNTLRAEVMRAAWGIAKEAAAKFGGSSRDFIGEAMRMAWAQVKGRAA